MNYSNLGYFFELRKDINGNYGLKEDFKCLFKGEEGSPNRTLELTITAGVDFMGNILKPAYNSIDNGFIPLSTQINGDTKEELDISVSNFCKSHKPWFSIINKSFFLVVDGKLVYDVTKNRVKENNLTFYVPKTTSDTYDGFKTKKGEKIPSLLTYKLDINSGLNKMKINENVLNALYQHVLHELEPSYCISREIYTIRRMNYQPIKEIPENSWIRNYTKS